LEKLKTGRSVLPGQTRNKPFSNMAMEMVLRRMKIEDATVHGFRSSFRDWAGNVSNFPREITETALAHVIGDKAVLAPWGALADTFEVSARRDVVAADGIIIGVGQPKIPTNFLRRTCPFSSPIRYRPRIHHRFLVGLRHSPTPPHRCPHGYGRNRLLRIAFSPSSL
jgi:hypothetical protein